MAAEETRFVSPTRICLSGEDLDWLGYRCCCVGIDLPIAVTLQGPESISQNEFYVRAWQAVVGLGESLVDPPSVRIETEAPVGSGLSTSSSLILSLIQAFHFHLEKPVPRAHALARLGYQAEYAISRGGGMDHLTIALGGALLMQGRQMGLPRLLGRTAWPADSVGVLLIESGEAKLCKEHIRYVRNQVRMDDPQLREYVTIVDECSQEVWDAIRGQRLPEMAGAVNRAHEAMRDLQGMSTQKIELLRGIALDCGCVGVKLTGSGGGGCLIAIADLQETGALKQRLCSMYRTLGITAHVRQVRPTNVGASWTNAACQEG